MRVESAGKPVVFVLTPGQQRETGVLEESMDQGRVRRVTRHMIPGSARRNSEEVPGTTDPP